MTVEEMRGRRGSIMEECRQHETMERRMDLYQDVCKYTHETRRHLVRRLSSEFRC